MLKHCFCCGNNIQNFINDKGVISKKELANGKNIKIEFHCPICESEIKFDIFPSKGAKDVSI